MPLLHTVVPESVAEIEVMEASEHGSKMMPTAPKVLICPGQISEQLRSPCPCSQIFMAFFKSSGNKGTSSISFPFPGREQCTINARLCFSNVVSSSSRIGLTQLKKLVSSTHVAVNECLSHSNNYNSLASSQSARPIFLRRARMAAFGFPFAMSEGPVWAVRVRQIDGNLADSALHPRSAESSLC